MRACEHPVLKDRVFTLFAEKEGTKLGVLEANPLDSPYLAQEVYTPYPKMDEIQSRGFNPSEILYVSCFLIPKQERENWQVVTLLFEEAVKRARKMGKRQICYMEITQDENVAKVL